jgi:septal ring factor EnvC (AmiA/AmiB activator)
MKETSRNYIARILLIGLFLFTMGYISAQTARELETQRRAALEDIELTTRLLNEVRSSAQNSLNRLNLLSGQIQARRKVISLLNQEITAIDRAIAAMNRELVELEKDLKSKREMYARSVQSMYTRRASQYKWLYVLSADNFARIIRRMRYVREYADWQKRQAALIMQKQEEINRKQLEIEQSRAGKSALLSVAEEESKQLIKEEAEQKTVVQQLNSRQSTLQTELNQKRRLAEALNRQIEQLIAKDNTTRSGTAPTSAADLKLSDDFATNRGRLPSPVTERYRIVTPFGEYQHPQWRNVRMQSTGIEIQTASGAEARAVFNGEVTSVFVLPDNSRGIIIRHGLYFTMYAYLSEVYVKSGDKIATSQKLGKILTDASKGNSTILHFEIRRGIEKLNPELWLN